MYIARLASIAYFVLISLGLYSLKEEAEFDTLDSSAKFVSYLLFVLPGLFVFIIGFSNKFRLFLTKYSNGISSILGLFELILFFGGIINAIFSKKENTDNFDMTMLFIFCYLILFSVILFVYLIIDGEIDRTIEDGRYKAAMEWGKKNDPEFARMMKDKEESDKKYQMKLDKKYTKEEQKKMREDFMNNL
jgi:hypothetical protein